MSDANSLPEPAGAPPTHRWFRIGLAVVLVVVSSIALYAPDYLPPLPEGWRSALVSPSKALVAKLLGEKIIVLKDGDEYALGPSVISALPRSTKAGAAMGHMGLKPDMWAARFAPLVSLMLLVGALLAALTWPVGLVRMGLLVISALVLPTALLILLDGAFVTERVLQWADQQIGDASQRPVGTGLSDIFLSSGTRVLVTTVIVVGLWTFLKAIVVEDGPETPTSSRARTASESPPLLWGALAGAALAIPVSLLCALGAVNLGATPMVAVAYTARAGLGLLAAIFLLLTILGQRWASRVAWLPLAAMAFAGADFSTSFLFMVTVIGLNHKRLAAAAVAPGA